MHLIPGELSWLPNTERERGDKDCCVLVLDDYLDDDLLRGGHYTVVHYTSKAVGQAFGPLALDQTIRFCSVLQTLLKQFKHVTVPKTQDPRESANLAVLLGAFLLLSRSWSVQNVVDKMPEEACLLFTCSWAKQSAPAPLLTVRDCWFGLDMAREQKWLDLSDSDDTLRIRLSCTMYQMSLLHYDASWLVPGKILVSADPVSTIQDPNPATCKALTPSPMQASVFSPQISEISSLSPALVVGEHRESATPISHSTPSKKTSLTTHTVAKEYDARAHAVGVSSEAQDFLSFTEGVGVELVVRANTGDEAGLRQLGGTYDRTVFTSVGITHLDAPVPDVRGAVPSSDTVRCVLRSCERVKDTGVVLLHCKGWMFNVVCFVLEGEGSGSSHDEDMRSE